MPEDLGDGGMAERVSTIACHTVTQERQARAMPELSYHQPNQRYQHQIMLRLIFNRLKAKAEELLTETVYLIKRHNKNFFFLFCT